MTKRLPKGLRVVLAVLGPVCAVLAVWALVAGNRTLLEAAMVTIALALAPAVWRSDERLSTNIARSGRNAFFGFLAGLPAAAVALHLYPSVTTAENALGALFFGLLFVFAGSLFYYERRGA
jgi:hypothetical protein